MRSSKILVVEDDASMGFFLCEAMNKEGYHASPVPNGEEALSRLRREDFDLVILDLKLPRMSGMDVLANIKRTHPDTTIIMITAHGSRRVALEALRKGAYDYFSKPFDINEMRIVIRRALEKTKLQREVQSLKNRVEGKVGLRNIIGKSKAVHEVFEIVETVVDNDVTVLITGESGTGKELIAEAIHYNSPRRAHPMVKLNCAAIPETLLESELFGYERGAFTGATKRKLGKFEMAHGGTLLLDEIGDLSLATQSKLLRVLQEQEFERVGGVEPIRVDVRIIAATNRDLRQRVQEGKFREDLFFRLKVLPIHIAPLRERREDIPLLVEHFLKIFQTRYEKRIEKISEEAMDLLVSYSWPGNVRELENAIQRAVVLSGDSVVQEWNLPPEIQGREERTFGGTIRLDSGLSLGEKVESLTREMEKRLIVEALDKASGKREKAARLLNLSIKTLYNKMKKYDLLGR
ncbi:MAG: response regulator [Proteobacteria bacterium]|nr:response regulator [Pseudomonadota bacterium]